MTHPLSLYRAYIRHLKHIPDPHIWRTHLPYFRSLLDRPVGSPEQNGETSREGAMKEDRRLRGLVRAKKELSKLKAAVACHPHAFRRLLEEAYARKGRVRWEMINNIIRSSPCLEPTSERALPAPLLPLKPVPIKPNIAPSARLRPLPAVALRKAAKKKSDRDWQEVQVPLVLPPSHEGWRTGWEDLGPVESLRILAGLDKVTEGRNSSGSNIQPGLAESTPARASPFPPPLPLARHLPSFSSLPPHIRLLLPHRRLPPIPRLQSHPSPPAAHTRPNPRTWGPVRAFRPRLIRRAYKRLWESLTWVRPVSAHGEGGERWKKVDWDGLHSEKRSGEGGPEGDRVKKAKNEPKEKKEWKGRKKQDHPPKNQL